MIKSQVIIMTFRHHYGPTEDFALDARRYLESLGYDAPIFLTDDPNLQNLFDFSIKQKINAVLVIGTPPLSIRINE